MENPASHGLELPEAGKTSPGERRRSGTTVETPDMAAYKKSPGNLKSRSFSSTRAASRLSLVSERPGVFAARLRSSRWLDTGPRYPRSRRSVFPLAENTLGFTSASTPPEISGGLRPWDSSGISSNILSVDLSFSGTEAPFTSPDRSSDSLKIIPESWPTTSPRTPRNSTLPNLSGLTSSARPLTASLETLPTLRGSLNARPTDLEDLKGFFDPVSGLLNFHGDNITFARVNRLCIF